MYFKIGVVKHTTKLLTRENYRVRDQAEIKHINSALRALCIQRTLISEVAIVIVWASSWLPPPEPMVGVSIRNLLIIMRPFLI